jgi:hypothetical protein
MLTPGNATSLYCGFVLAGVVACSGGDSSGPKPTGPNTPTISVSSVSVTGTPPTIGGTVQFTAMATFSNGITQDVTSQATWQSSNPAILTVSALGVVTAVGLGDADVRATYQSVSGSQHVTLVGPILTTFLRDYVEAIFLGSGPLSPTDGNYACPSFKGTWTGFPRGTPVKVRISTTVSLDKRQAIQQAVAQVTNATGGTIQTTMELTDDPNPIPGTNEVTSTSYSNPSSQGCPSDNGCTIHTFGAVGVLVSSRAVQPPAQTPNAYAHDVVGHGILGMCHVDGNLIGGAGLSLMSGGPNVFSGQTAIQLSPDDIAAAQAVYRSGLNPGATKSDFMRAGLINP